MTGAGASPTARGPARCDSRRVHRMTALHNSAGLLLGISVIGIIVWVSWLVRTSLLRVGSKTVREGLHLPAPEGGWPRLSIIVPVHNEERLIDTCANSLRRLEYDKLEIIFVLDRCTDDTARLLAVHAAADPRIVIVTNDTCPDDWAGKCHAAHLGAEQASGDWMLFTDADTWFDPQLARAAVALAGDRDLALLSLLSTLTFEHFFEQVAQVAAAVKLLSLYPIERVNRSRRPRPFANGQFLLFRRDWYERFGGHAALKDDLLEDIAAAKLVNGHGGHSAVVLSDGMLMCSMYESLAEFRQGWKRIFIEACNRKPARLRKWAARTLVIDVALPLVQLVTLASAPAVAFAGQVPLAVAMTLIVLTGWTLQGAVLWRFYAMGRAPRLAILLYPIGCLIVGRIMLAGARDLKRRRPVIWGGKRYVLTPR